jgi:hypothetical protein
MQIGRFVKDAPMFVILITTVALVNRGHAEVKCRELMNPPGKVCESGIPSHFIHIAALKNPMFQSQWCWAACIAMVFEYYGHPVRQERLVSEAYGGLVNMPAQPWTMLAMLNRAWIDDNGKKFTCSSTSGSSNPLAAANDLAEDRPLIIGALGHAVVLTGLEYVAFYQRTPWGLQLGPVNIINATVRDPLPGKGLRRLSGMEWANITFAVQIRIY